MYGPHNMSDFFSGDNRHGTALSTEVLPAPAWLVADWMIMRRNGQPLTPLQAAFCDQSTQNRALLWLRDYLR